MCVPQVREGVLLLVGAEIRLFFLSLSLFTFMKFARRHRGLPAALSLATFGSATSEALRSVWTLLQALG